MPPGPHARVKACGRTQVGMNSFHAVLHVPLCECNLAQYARPHQLFDKYVIIISTICSLYHAMFYLQYHCQDVHSLN